MGIQFLNSYIKKNTSTKSLEKITLFRLYNKIIAVDISIYLYKFISNGDLLENFYSMLCTFYYYKIIPIFVFDGKPRAEKKELLEMRKMEKINAEKEYYKLEKIISNFDIQEDKLENIKLAMDCLKKKFNKFKGFNTPVFYIKQ